MALRIRKNKMQVPPSLCPLTACVSLLGGAWGPNVIWYLGGGPRRFGELRKDIPPVSARVLSARLRELQENGVVTRRVCDTSPPSVEYELTELGRELLPAIEAIARVGAKLKRGQPPDTGRRVAPSSPGRPSRRRAASAAGTPGGSR
jgi:DNA-binding HxlR family transcriptional regulator